MRTCVRVRRKMQIWNLKFIRGDHTGHRGVGYALPQAARPPRTALSAAAAYTDCLPRRRFTGAAALLVRHLHALRLAHFVDSYVDLRVGAVLCIFFAVVVADRRDEGVVHDLERAKPVLVAELAVVRIRVVCLGGAEVEAERSTCVDDEYKYCAVQQSHISESRERQTD